MGLLDGMCPLKLVNGQNPWEESFFVIVIIYGSTFIYIDNFNLFISAEATGGRQ